jgi:hypothetical protein
MLQTGFEVVKAARSHTEAPLALSLVLAIPPAPRAVFPRASQLACFVYFAFLAIAYDNGGDRNKSMGVFASDGKTKKIESANARR